MLPSTNFGPSHFFGGGTTGGGTTGGVPLTDFSNLAARVTVVETVSSQNTTAIGELTTISDLLEQDTTALKQATISLVGRVEHLENATTLLREDVNWHSSQISDIQQRAALLNQYLGDLTNRVVSIESGFEDLTTIVTENTSDITKIESDVAALTTTVSNFDAAINKNTTDISALTTTVSTLGSAVTQNTTDIVNLTTTVNGNTAKITKNADDITALKDTVLQNYLTHDSRFLRDEAFIQHQGLEIDDINVRLDTNTAAVATVTTNLASLTSTVSTLDTNLRHEINVVDTRLTDRMVLNERDIAIIDERSLSALTRCDAVETRQQTLETTVSTFASDIALLKQTIKTMAKIEKPFYQLVAYSTTNCNLSCVNMVSNDWTGSTSADAGKNMLLPDATCTYLRGNTCTMTMTLSYSMVPCCMALLYFNGIPSPSVNQLVSVQVSFGTKSFLCQMSNVVKTAGFTSNTYVMFDFDAEIERAKAAGTPYLPSRTFQIQFNINQAVYTGLQTHKPAAVERLILMPSPTEAITWGYNCVL